MDRSFVFENTDFRAEMASEIREMLGVLPGVTDVRLYGSLSQDQADVFSDIDMTVTLCSYEDRSFAESIPLALRSVGSLLIDGWGLGSLPGMYIKTLYFDRLPLFWHVDICCLSDIHVDGSDIKAQYHWQQIFKMWIACVKGYVRGKDTLTPFMTHVARKNDVSQIKGDEKHQLASLLDLVARRTESKGIASATMIPLLSRCHALRDRFLS